MLAGAERDSDSLSLVNTVFSQTDAHHLRYRCQNLTVCPPHPPQLSVLKTLLLRSVGEAPMSDWGSPWASDEADEEGGAGQWANDAGAAQAEAEAGGPKPSRSPPGEAHPHPPPSSASGSQAAARGSLAESAPPEGAGRGTTAPPSPSRLRRGRSQGSLFLSKPELGEAAGGSVDGGDGADGGGGEPGAGEEGSCADTVGGSESGVAEESGGPEEASCLADGGQDGPSLPVRLTTTPCLHCPSGKEGLGDRRANEMRKR